MARTYNQSCVLAYALDLLGERWTLLIVRNLFLGPQRFGDLQSGLPGIGANLLSKRLKELEEAGLVASPSSGDAPRAKYKLTTIAETLRPTIRSLMRWSIQYFVSQPNSSVVQEYLKSNDQNPDSMALAIEIFAGDHPEPDLNYVAHAFIDGDPYTLYYMNSEMIARRGADAPAVAAMTADVASIMQAFRHELSQEETKKRLALSGDEKAVAHLLKCMTEMKKDNSQDVQNVAAE